MIDCPHMMIRRHLLIERSLPAQLLLRGAGIDRTAGKLDGRPGLRRFANTFRWLGGRLGEDFNR
jgi:hypothetical protein